MGGHVGANLGQPQWGGGPRRCSRQSGRDRGLPRRAGGSMMLGVRDLEVAYGNIPALRGITLEVEKGEIVTLIGANGAGKTTTLRTISGLLKPRRGQVHYNDKNITATKPHVITAIGVSHVPQRRGICA